MRAKGDRKDVGIGANPFAHLFWQPEQVLPGQVTRLPIDFNQCFAFSERLGRDSIQLLQVADGDTGEETTPDP